ncbi:50S ribosomal protein L23 [Plesiocystis pacifica SIR-1]|uniref:Large ribosomal subunit protein uL23 n=1 Tax=Plesiocystis pacifica SIR-1 TaxID=391625 RepID=A6GCH7_9BACT|nr:50S ribosomal protein L23 [Plesiocystis pacifica]EDM76434.1 50S ribosomal protein L23 [Plesiocystis pacifica SIR-1]
MTPQEIIIRPILSEKSTQLEAINNQYTFEVHRQANKIEIRKAVEMVFGVRVEKVRTMVMRGDLRRVGRFYGKTRQWKKAVVTLHPGDSIELYGED